MSRHAQNSANRANALLSTGPRTAQGKRRSSLNAIRHGLTAQAVVMPSEDVAAYQNLVASYFADLQPKGAVERQFVQTLVDTAWRMNRIAILENNLFAFESQDGDRRADPEIRSSVSMISALSDHNRDLATLSLHEQRLSRLSERTLKQLLQLQATRRQREEAEMASAANLRKLHEMKDLPYEPAEDGFVFSNSEIDSYIHRTQRVKEANAAACHDFKQAGGGR